MEERIIDDEINRKIRLKKTADGYIDATDAELDDEETDAVEFSFPVFDADDEELAGLTPEEAMEVQRRREEEAKARKAEYDALCLSGEEFLSSKSYHSAELSFEKALKIAVDDNTTATVGLWRAKTQDFENPDVLVDEYAEKDLESLELDLGYKAVDELRARYQTQLKARESEWLAEEKQLSERVESTRLSRKSYLKPLLKKKALWFGISAVPFLVALILTVVFGLKNFSVKGDEYVIPTIICTGVLLITFFVLVFFSNKFINALRLYRANERLWSTEEGRRLLLVRDYVRLYAQLTAQNPPADE